MSMTKKEQAIHNFWEFHNSKFQNLYPSFPINKRLENIINLDHAIDDADRQERGVMDVQEIKTCWDCSFYCDEGCCCNHPHQSERKLFQDDHRLPGPPSWCPRRKENRK